MNRTLRLSAATAAVLALGACAGTGFGSPATPVNASDAYAVGKAHFAAGRLGLALDAFQAAHRSDPASADALNGVGAVYDRMGRHVLAERAYLDALALAPEDPVTLNNIGWSRHLRGQVEAAAFYLAHAARLAPDHPTVGANLAWVRSHQPEPAPPLPLDIREAAADRPRVVRQNAGEQMLITSIAKDAPKATPITEAKAQAGTGTWAWDGIGDGAVPPPLTVLAAAAEALERTPAPTLRPSIAGVEVSNGTGKRLMATRLGHWLGQQGIGVARLTNAGHFAHARSAILYQSESGRSAAEALAALLPTPVEVRPGDEGQTSPLRLVLGADLLDFDNRLLTTQRSRDHDLSPDLS